MNVKEARDKASFIVTLQPREQDVWDLARAVVAVAEAVIQLTDRIDRMEVRP